MTHKPLGEIIKQEKFRSNFERSLINILYTSNFIRDAHQEIFSKYKLQSQHYNVLRILKGKHPNNVQPGYIKEVMLDKGCDLTRLLDKLQKLSIVHRAVEPTNKRKVNITLTEYGLKILADMTQMMDNMDKTMESNLSSSEHEQLSMLLDKFRK